MIIGLTLFSWSPAILALAGHRDPALPAKLIGVMAPPSADLVSGKTRIPAPKLMLAAAVAVVGLICAFSVPWQDTPLPKDR